MSTPNNFPKGVSSITFPAPQPISRTRVSYNSPNSSALNEAYEGIGMMMECIWIIFLNHSFIPLFEFFRVNFCRKSLHLLVSQCEFREILNGL
jgi:hypothetical protein